MHIELQTASVDDKVVWASAPSGQEAWGVVDYTQHPDEPFFAVTYFDGDVSVGVCAIDFHTFEEAKAFASTRPLVDGAYDITCIE